MIFQQFMGNENDNNLMSNQPGNPDPEGNLGIRKADSAKE
jgi:hypothetical protein